VAQFDVAAILSVKWRTIHDPSPAGKEGFRERPLSAALGKKDSGKIPCTRGCVQGTGEVFG
jgi:hypothetical protein